MAVKKWNEAANLGLKAYQLLRPSFNNDKDAYICFKIDFLQRAGRDETTSTLLAIIKRRIINAGYDVK